MMARFLIVDDSKIMRSLIHATLKKLGHQIVGEATTGLEGYEKYFELKPDVVTMDITMPMLNGIDTLKKIKAEDENAKIILITANMQGAKLNNAINAGANGYLFKPLDEVELTHLLEQIL
jgi:two-component system chemotaxis response regulator CheY